MTEATLRVGTVNILRDQARWAERRDLLADGLAEANLDLVALQEVHRPGAAENPARWLARRLGGGYEVFERAKTGRRGGEGIAILSRVPVDRHETIELTGQDRVAQRVMVRAGGRAVAFVNGHYYWVPLAHRARARQFRETLDWLGGLDPDVATVWGGDFNALPGSPELAEILSRMRSAYRDAHEGRDPDYTCPTPLASPNPVVNAVVWAALRLCTNRPGRTWRGVLDYLFVGPGVRVVDAWTFLDRPSPTDPRLYPSDHLGLASTLRFSPAAGPSPSARVSSADVSNPATPTEPR